MYSVASLLLQLLHVSDVAASVLLLFCYNVAALMMCVSVAKVLLLAVTMLLLVLLQCCCRKCAAVALCSLA